MTVDDLASQLYAVAEARAQAVGRNLGEGADHDLRLMTQRGAGELLAITDVAERQSKIEAAKADIIRLIDMAIGNAQAIHLYPETLLGEDSYFPAKLRFCPCRPFC